jgi:hypothetical protein
MIRVTGHSLKVHETREDESRPGLLMKNDPLFLEKEKASGGKTFLLEASNGNLPEMSFHTALQKVRDYAVGLIKTRKEATVEKYPYGFRLSRGKQEVGAQKAWNGWRSKHLERKGLRLLTLVFCKVTIN